MERTRGTLGHLRRWDRQPDWLPTPTADCDDDGDDDNEEDDFSKPPSSRHIVAVSETRKVPRKSWDHR